MRDVAPGVNSECSDKTYFEKVDEMYNWYWKADVAGLRYLTGKKYENVCGN